MIKRLIPLISILFLLACSAYADTDKAYDDYQKATKAYWQDDWDQAERLLISALPNIARTDGYRASALELLANIYQKKQQYLKAVPLWKELVHIYQTRKPEPDQKGMIIAYEGLLNTYFYLRDFPQAAAVSETLAPLQEQLYGSDSVKANYTYANLGTLYMHLHRITEARALFEKSIPILEKAVPPNDNILVSAKDNYRISKIRNANVISVTDSAQKLIKKGDDAFRQGEKDLAVESFQHALSIVIQEHGPQSPGVPILKRKLKEAQAMSATPTYLHLLDKPIVRWHDKTKSILVYIEPGQRFPNWKPEYNELVKKAFNTWEEALGHRHAIEFVDTPSDVDVLVRWHITPLLSNREGFRRLGINSAEVWNGYIASNNIDISLEDPIESSDSLYLVLLHEIGHLMGIRGHSDNPSDVLFNYTQSGWKPQTQLSPRDIATIQAIYNRPADISNPPKIRLSNFEAFRRKKEAEEDSASQSMPEFTWE